MCHSRFLPVISFTSCGYDLKMTDNMSENMSEYVLGFISSSVAHNIQNERVLKAKIFLLAQFDNKNNALYKISLLRQNLSSIESKPPSR